MTFIVARIIWY